MNQKLKSLSIFFYPKKNIKLIIHIFSITTEFKFKLNNILLYVIFIEVFLSIIYFYYLDLIYLAILSVFIMFNHKLIKILNFHMK